MKKTERINLRMDEDLYRFIRRTAVDLETDDTSVAARWLLRAAQKFCKIVVQKDIAKEVRGSSGAQTNKNKQNNG